MNIDPFTCMDQLRARLRHDRQAGAFALGAAGGVTATAGLSLAVAPVGELILMVLGLAALLWILQHRAAR